MTLWKRSPMRDNPLHVEYSLTDGMGIKILEALRIMHHRQHTLPLTMQSSRCISMGISVMFISLISSQTVLGLSMTSLL